MATEYETVKIGVWAIISGIVDVDFLQPFIWSAVYWLQRWTRDREVSPTVSGLFVPLTIRTTD